MLELLSLLRKLCDHSKGYEPIYMIFSKIYRSRHGNWQFNCGMDPDLDSGDFFSLKIKMSECS